MSNLYSEKKVEKKSFKVGYFLRILKIRWFAEAGDFYINDEKQKIYKFIAHIENTWVISGKDTGTKRLQVDWSPLNFV